MAILIAAWTTLAAACSPVQELPPLPTDPTEAELTPHVARYCSRLQACAIEDPTAGPECMAKLLGKTQRPGDRRGMAAMMNMFGPCMTMDCMSMTACFMGTSIKEAKEQMDKSPPPPRAP